MRWSIAKCNFIKTIEGTVFTVTHNQLEIQNGTNLNMYGDKSHINTLLSQSQIFLAMTKNKVIIYILLLLAVLK